MKSTKLIDQSYCRYFARSRLPELFCAVASSWDRPAYPEDGLRRASRCGSEKPGVAHVGFEKPAEV